MGRRTGLLPRLLLVRVQLPQPFFIFAIVTYVKEVAELAVLAMSMFLAAFFCLRIILLPQNATKAIEQIYEVEEAISEKRPSTR